MLYLLVYLACLSIEFMYIRQTKALIEDRIASTMFWTGMLHTIGKVSTLLFVLNPWAIIPAVIGHVSGTYLGMWSRRMQNKKVGGVFYVNRID